MINNSKGSSTVTICKSIEVVLISDLIQAAVLINSDSQYNLTACIFFVSHYVGFSIPFCTGKGSP